MLLWTCSFNYVVCVQCLTARIMFRVISESFRHSSDVCGCVCVCLSRCVCVTWDSEFLSCVLLWASGLCSSLKCESCVLLIWRHLISLTHSVCVCACVCVCVCAFRTNKLNLPCSLNVQLRVCVNLQTGNQPWLLALLAVMPCVLTS